MSPNIWTAIKDFFTQHSEHATVEKILMILAIISGAIVCILGIHFIFKISKNNCVIRKKTRKITKVSDKQILDLLKKKKNQTF